MGAIQGSVNALLGTGAAAILATSNSIEGAKEQAAIKTEQGLLAKEQFHEASADLTQLEDEAKKAEAILSEKTAVSDALAAKHPGGKGNTKEALNEKRASALTETEAAQRAFSELKDRIEAKVAMRDRAESIMKRTGTWGGMK